MAFGRFFPKIGNYAIERINAEEAPAIAELHIEGFGRPWSDGEFAALLSAETVFGFVARREGKPSDRPAGFVLARLAADEAEILTIAVARARRGKGLGRALMEAVLRHLHAERTKSLFLEVDERNNWAIAMYRRLGFTEVGRRSAYYRTGGPDDGTALVMRLDLR